MMARYAAALPCVLVGLLAAASYAQAGIISLGPTPTAPTAPTPTPPTPPTASPTTAPTVPTPTPPTPPTAPPTVQPTALPTPGPTKPKGKISKCYGHYYYVPPNHKKGNINSHCNDCLSKTVGFKRKIGGTTCYNPIGNDRKRGGYNKFCEPEDLDFVFVKGGGSKNCVSRKSKSITLYLPIERYIGASIVLAAKRSHGKPKREFVKLTSVKKWWIAVTFKGGFRKPFLKNYSGRTVTLKGAIDGKVDYCFEHKLKVC